MTVCLTYFQENTDYPRDKWYQLAVVFFNENGDEIGRKDFEASKNDDGTYWALATATNIVGTTYLEVSYPPELTKSSDSDLTSKYHSARYMLFYYIQESEETPTDGTSGSEENEYVNEKEDNNTPEQAQLISLGQPVHGSFESLGDVDWYKFVLNQRSDIKLAATSDDYKKDAYLWVWLYDSTGTKKFAYVQKAENATDPKEMASILKGEFGAGTYYISVSVFGGSNDSKYVGSKYTLTVEATPKSDVTPSYDNFTKKNTYTDGLFTDVPSNQWYAETVKTAYELGLTAGSSATTYNPEGNVTIAETLAFACRLHSIYTTGEAEFKQGNPWYQVYVDYAIANGIIKEGDYTDYTATATRAQFVGILAKALPADALTKINDITALPDVSSSDAFAEAVFALYNAGVLTGSDTKGTFNPSSNIRRSEVATIVARMAVPSLRKSFTLAA